MIRELFNKSLKSFDQSEIFMVKSENYPVSFESNKLKEISKNQTSGLAIRGIKNGRLGLSSTTDPKRRDELLGRISNLVLYGPETKMVFPGRSHFIDLNIYDDSLEEVKIDQVVNIVQLFIDKLTKISPTILVDSKIGYLKGNTRIINSSGFDCDYDYSGSYFYANANLIRGTDMLNIWDGCSSTGLVTKSQLDETFLKIQKNLEWSENITDSINSDGEISVIFTPQGFVGTFLGPLLEGFNGKNFANKTSPISDLINKKYFHEKFSIRDNPHLINSSQSRPFDDEGTPTRIVNFVEGGILLEPYYDLQTSSQIGEESSGSGSRSLSSNLYPSITNIEVNSGEEDSSNIISRMKNGIIVDSLLGAGQGNELGGEFKANVSLGFRVINGNVVGRIKDTMISGNIYKCLAQIESISSDFERVYGSSKIPFIECKGVKVVSAS